MGEPNSASIPADIALRLQAIDERLDRIEAELVPLMLSVKKRREYMRKYMRDYRSEQ